MRELTYLIIFLLVVVSCDNSDEKDNQNNKTADVEVETQNNPENTEKEEPKELSYEEKIDSVLSSMGITTRDWDEIYQIIRDTAYVNVEIKSIKLAADTCPFIPYMLVVDDNKLQLLNHTFDSSYTLNTKLKIQTASVSPFNNSEIFVLVQSGIRKPDDEPGLWYYPTIFDLDLYKLNLDSMFMEGITTFYDNSVPFLKIQMELAGFFPDSSELKIDTARNLIYYNCLLEAFADESYLHGTYIVDLNKNKTILGDLKETAPNFIKGNDVLLYSNSYLKNQRFKAKVTRSEILISEIPDNKPLVKIQKYILGHSPNERDVNKELEYSDFFNICFLGNNEKIIFSYCREQEMGQLTGNIYFAGTNGGNPKLIIENRVIGYESDLRKIDDSFYLIENEPGPGLERRKELRIFDTNFNKVKHFKKLNHYEFFPR